MPPRKILLAEDDHDDRNLFHDYLAGRKDIVLLPIAEDGADLVDFLENAGGASLPDLIVLDQNMPRKSGIETLVFLKSDNRFAHIPIIVYSTYADEHLVHDCTTLGAALVVSKPYTNKGYHEMIDGFLRLID
jgi:CheY-like chemotaxis protein